MPRIKGKRRDWLFFETEIETCVPGVFDLLTGGLATERAMEELESQGFEVTEVQGGWWWTDE